MMFSGCNSTAHKMLSPNKQAHQQNKLSLHVRAIGETGSWKDQQRKQAFKKRPTVGWPVHCGSVTCDSLTMLSTDCGCLEDCNIEDGLADKAQGRLVCYVCLTTTQTCMQNKHLTVQQKSYLGAWILAMPVAMLYGW